MPSAVPSHGRAGLSPTPDNAAAGPGRGRRSADLDHLFPLVLGELRELAGQSLRGALPGNSLQATALVNEVYVRLAERDARWNDREHFMRLAGRVIRQILTDRARRRRAAKRQHVEQRVPLDDLVDLYEQRVADVIDLDDCLAEFGRFAPELVELVELRFFAGRSLEDIAALLGTSLKTVQRRWLAAKALLRHRLGRDDG